MTRQTDLPLCGRDTVPPKNEVHLLHKLAEFETANFYKFLIKFGMSINLSKS